MAGSAKSIETPEIELEFPPNSWHAANSAIMLDIATESAHKLSRAFSLPWREQTTCYVTDPHTAMDIQGVTGAAYNHMVIIGVDEGHLSDYARTVVHELAHILSQQVGKYECKFKGEGFACFANWLLDPNAITGGLPLHYHLVWMRSVGIDCSLEYLWHRKDYTCEIYDLAWSFAAFCVERYGLDRYMKLYASEGSDLQSRIKSSLREDIRLVEREWHSLAEGRIEVPVSEIPRMDRHAGFICSRAAWVRGQ